MNAPAHPSLARPGWMDRSTLVIAVHHPVTDACGTAFFKAEAWRSYGERTATTELLGFEWKCPETGALSFQDRDGFLADPLCRAAVGGMYDRARDLAMEDAA